jgi:hypothetical protein
LCVLKRPETPQPNEAKVLPGATFKCYEHKKTQQSIKAKVQSVKTLDKKTPQPMKAKVLNATKGICFTYNKTQKPRKAKVLTSNEHN